MKVLITGGTGFVGSHTVAAVVRQHDVRLLARSPERAWRALEPLGVTDGDVELVTGDVTDAESVRRSMQGCDAVIHAAAIYTLDSRRIAEMRRTNLLGSETVLDAAVDAGLDPIVHVSSLTVMFGHRGVLTPDHEPVATRGAYARSKAEAERVARRLQAQRAPVVTIYPSYVMGPHDPTLGESSRLPMQALRGTYRASPRGSAIIATDVRDLAGLHAAALERGRGPRRYFAPATRVPSPEMLARISAITGRRLRTTGVPPPLATAGGRALSVMQRVLPFRLPLDFEGIDSAITMGRIEALDDSRTRADFGILPRDIDETLRDALTWLYREGHVSAKQVGALAAATA